MFPGVSAARTENTDSALKFVKQTDTNLLLHFIFFLNKSCWFLMGSQVMCLGLIIYDDAWWSHY